MGCAKAVGIRRRRQEGAMSLRYGHQVRSKVLVSAVIVSLGAFLLNLVEAKPLQGLRIAGAILVISLLVHGGLLLWDQSRHRNG
jgi:hypothetical protein